MSLSFLVWRSSFFIFHLFHLVQPVPLLSFSVPIPTSFSNPYLFPQSSWRVSYNSPFYHLVQPKALGNSHFYRFVLFFLFLPGFRTPLRHTRTHPSCPPLPDSRNAFDSPSPFAISPSCPTLSSFLPPTPSSFLNLPLFLRPFSEGVQGGDEWKAVSHMCALRNIQPVVDECFRN